MDTQITFEEMARRGKEILDKQGLVTFEQAKAQIERLKKGSYLRGMMPEEIRSKLEELFTIPRDEPTRSVRILWTGPGGMDLFSECVENECGLTRIYASKIPRFARILKWRESHSKGLYRLIKMSK